MAANHSGQLIGNDPLTLTRQRLEHSDDRQLEVLRHTFAARQLVRLANFLSDDLVTEFHRRVAQDAFAPRLDSGIEIEETLVDTVSEALLIVPLNDPALFRAIDVVTQCGPIGCFTGRVFRRRAAAVGHYYPWHTDATHDRLVGLSVNLGRTPHAGGELQLRDANTHALIATASNTHAGDAVLFRIADDIEHHVTPVTGDVGRTVLAGWFRRRPDFWARAFAAPIAKR